MTADLLRPKPHIATNEKSANTFRRINLVTRKRQQVTAQRLNVNRKPPGGLNSISVKFEVTATILPRFSYQRSDFSDRLYRPDFVVSQHHANQNGVRPNSLAHILDSHDARVMNG